METIPSKTIPSKIVVRNRSEEEMTKANLGTRPLDDAGNGRALTKWKRNGAHAQTNKLISREGPMTENV
jgi:hypothetical protein